jgi:hypothetical protein
MLPIFHPIFCWIHFSEVFGCLKAVFHFSLGRRFLRFFTAFWGVRFFSDVFGFPRFFFGFVFGCVVLDTILRWFF